MPVVLMIAQLATWLIASFFIINALAIEAFIGKFAIFAVTGVVTGAFFSGVAMKLGIIDSNGDITYVPGNADPDAKRLVIEGRNFGNEVAESIGIEHNLFHAALEEGGISMHLIALARMKEAGMQISEVRENLLPVLDQGLEHIEQRFGGRQRILDARKVVDEWLQNLEG